MPADPKPAPRIVDNQAGMIKIRAEGRCRVCREYWPPVTRHHLVSRKQGGDDVIENIVPLCGSGTTGCHGDVEAYRGTARSELRANLTSDEVVYVIQKKGEAWLDRFYPK